MNKYVSQFVTWIVAWIKLRVCSRRAPVPKESHSWTPDHSWTIGESECGVMIGCFWCQKLNFGFSWCALKKKKKEKSHAYSLYHMRPLVDPCWRYSVITHLYMHLSIVSCPSSRLSTSTETYHSYHVLIQPFIVNKSHEKTETFNESRTSFRRSLVCRLFMGCKRNLEWHLPQPSLQIFPHLFGTLIQV